MPFRFPRNTSRSFRVSNSMLGLWRTTPQDYPEWSGFGRQREREWVTGGNGRGTKQEDPPMRIYIIANDGITLCREAPATMAEGEIVPLGP